MLSNAPSVGLELLARMAATAAERASAQLIGTIRLSKCESFELGEGSLDDNVDLESWAVNADRQAVVVSVFATAPQEGGGRRMAGSGRFIFTASARDGAYRS